MSLIDGGVGDNTVSTATFLGSGATIRGGLGADTITPRSTAPA